MGVRFVIECGWVFWPLVDWFSTTTTTVPDSFTSCSILLERLYNAFPINQNNETKTINLCEDLLSSQVAKSD